MIENPFSKFVSVKWFLFMNGNSVDRIKYKFIFLFLHFNFIDMHQVDEWR